MKKAVFLDRDGTINIDHGYFHEASKLEFVENSINGLKILSKKFILIVITNQAAIGEGIYIEKDCIRVNEKIKTELHKEKVDIKKFYYCPHRSNEYCKCRKPNTGMIIKASEDFPIDMNKSWIVGDKISDIKTSENIKIKFPGFRSILVLTGIAGRDMKYKTKPDFIAKDLLEASSIITREDAKKEA